MKQILTKLKEYNPKDFKDWKEHGLTELFFQYVRDKRQELRDYILNEFDGCAINAGKIDDIKTRQAFASCLGALDSVSLEAMIEYYEGKQGNE